MVICRQSHFMGFHKTDNGEGIVLKIMKEFVIIQLWELNEECTNGDKYVFMELCLCYWDFIFEETVHVGGLSTVALKYLFLKLYINL